MATTSVTSKYLKTEGHGKNSGKSAVEYVESEQVHHADDTVTSRNLRRSSNCGNFSVVYGEYSKRLKQEKGDRKTVAFFSIVQSFSKEELDYRSPDDVDLAHEAGCELARRLAKQYPNRAWGVWTQADGDSHHLHNHIYFMNYDNFLKAVPHKDTYRALDWKDVSELNDKVCEDVLGKKSKPVRSPARQKLLEEGYSPFSDGGRKSRKKSQHKADVEHINKAFAKAIAVATSEQELSRLLAQQGVFVQLRGDMEKDDQGHDLRWKTKSGRYRKALTLKFKGTKVRTDKLDNPMSTAAIVSKLVGNAIAEKKLQAQEKVHQENRQKQRKINIERTSEESKPTGRPNVKTKPATRNVRGGSGYHKSGKTDKNLEINQATEIKPSSQQELLNQIENKLNRLRELKNKTDAQRRQEKELQQKFNEVQNEIITRATQISAAQLKKEAVWGE